MDARALHSHLQSLGPNHPLNSFSQEYLAQTYHYYNSLGNLPQNYYQEMAHARGFQYEQDSTRVKKIDPDSDTVHAFRKLASQRLSCRDRLLYLAA